MEKEVERCCSGEWWRFSEWRARGRTRFWKICDAMKEFHKIMHQVHELDRRRMKMYKNLFEY